MIHREAQVAPNWSNLVAAQTPLALTGHVVPALTMARDEWAASEDAADQVACSIIGMFIDSMAANVDAPTSGKEAAGAAPDTPFETLCKMVFRWAVAAIQPGPVTAAQVDALPIGEEDLDRLREILQSTDENPTPIPLSAIDSFMARQFQLTAAITHNGPPLETTFFPVPPGLQLTVPAIGDAYRRCHYSFGEYNSIDSRGVQRLRGGFGQLTVQVSHEMPLPAIAEADAQSLSINGWIFADYFLLIARQMVQAARDGLRPALGTTPAMLAAQRHNGTVSDLFDPSSTPNLHRPHLARFQVGVLIAEAQRRLALQRLTDITSRYYLNGLRVLTSGIRPGAIGMWVHDDGGTLTLPPVAGLYALTGQQVPLPLDALTAFSARLDVSGGPSWLVFQDGHGALASSLRVTLDADNITSITNVASYAHTTRLNVGLTALRSGPMFKREPATFALASSLLWESPTPLSLPYGTPPAGVVVRRIWRLPDSMVNLPDPSTRAVNPRFSVKAERHDEATGGTIQSSVTYYGWASIVTFTVKRVPKVAGSPATTSTYEIVGAAGNDLIVLERLVSQAGSKDDIFASLNIGYTPDQTDPASPSVQTDPAVTTTIGIAQLDLLTVAPLRAFLRASVKKRPAPGWLNAATDVLRLLWEASSATSGGVYLYYFNGAAGTGLPDRIFNDKQEAELTLIAVHKPTTADAANRLSNFMNAVVIGDSIDTRAVLFAEADPPTNPYWQIPSSAEASLADIAHAHYSDPGDLARLNSTLTLAPGKPVAVNHGVFQAPLDGASLSAIARQFGVAVTAIELANPGNLPDPLVFPGAIRLPSITVSAGSNANTTTLAAIASFYGEDLAALAADNAALPGIFAPDQTVTVTGSLCERVATVPPGVQSLYVRRPAPPPVPNDPTDPAYAVDFLLNRFSLLSCEVAANGFFTGSKIALPTSPTTDHGESTQAGSVRRTTFPASGGDWIYEQSLPYSRFAPPLPPAASDLPPSALNPYAGVGSLLHVSFDWQDQFGNRLVTTLTDRKNDDAGPFNAPPMLTGYVDPLIGVGRWPSVTSAWQVLPGSENGHATIKLLFTFDDRPYQGLLDAAAPAATSVTVRFTEPLDPPTAADTSHYSLPDGVAVQNAVLSADGLSVVLSLAGPLSPGPHLLIVSGLKTTANAGVAGQAAFDFPDDPATRTSTVQQKAAADLQLYRQLYYQLTDPNGVAFSIETSLLSPTNGHQARLPVRTSLLMSWLFSDPNSIYRFIHNRSTFQTTVAAPAGQLQIDVALTPAEINTAPVFRLSLSITMERTLGTVIGDLTATSGIRQSSTIVLPRSAPAAHDNRGGIELTQFAAQFQQALSQPGYLLKIATGIDRTQVSSATNGRAVWVVRLGRTPSQPISCAITDAGAPSLFARQPFSNRLRNYVDVPIHEYSSPLDGGHGISPTPTTTLTFTDIDADVWWRQLCAAVDAVLTPQLIAPAQIVVQHKNTDYLQQLLDVKDTLAGIVARRMMPVFAGEHADPTAAQQVFYQRLLSRLSNAYTTHAAIEFHATVNANVSDPASDHPPRLHGHVVLAEPGGNAHGIALTSPTLTLSSGEAQPLTCLLVAPEMVTDSDGTVLAVLDLDLAYDGARIEHQISAVPGNGRCLTSSWLDFVVTDPVSPLDQGLGAVRVPLPLCSYPASPAVIQQSGCAAHPDTADLAGLTEWTYNLTYTLPYHYPQDRVYCAVDFNLRSVPGPERSSVDDASAALAEFVTVFPAVDADLNRLLAPIDATVNDEARLDAAAIPLASLVRLVTAVATTAPEYPLGRRALPRRRVGADDLTYSFYVQESSIDLPDARGSLLVSLVGARPAGIGEPQLLIEGYDCLAHEGTDGEHDTCDRQQRFCFVYRKRGSDTEYLSRAIGQAIPERRIVLTDLDILQRQTALAAVCITRNEGMITNRETAAPFLYTTPDVRFSNALWPTLDSVTPVSIPSIGSQQPVTRTLSDQLMTLFAALLIKNVEPELAIKAEVTYEYPPSIALDSARFPILLQEPLTVTIAGSGPGTLAQMISEWNTAIAASIKAYSPAERGGTLWLDLTVMANVTGQAVPLLRLRKLGLPTQYVEGLGR